jgi:branched-chain amino acid transport system ATP-binding protein
MVYLKFRGHNTIKKALNFMNAESLLTINHLSMRFSGLCALNNVQFQVKKRSITALIGPNGAGKTTLFNCITGFYRPTHGEIILTHEGTSTRIEQLLGEPFSLKQLSLKTLPSWTYYKMFGGSHLVTRSGIVRTFQNNRLFQNMTVLENLLVAQHIFAPGLWQGTFRTTLYQSWRKEAFAKAFHWLEVFSLSGEANRLAKELPYGKQRHLEIARALCTNPILLCLDEPAAGLNPSETAQLKDILLMLAQSTELTLLLIEHDMSLVMKIADKIVVLDHGVVISEGPPAEVSHDDKVIKAYLGED